jgi:hypothetical protein
VNNPDDGNASSSPRMTILRSPILFLVFNRPETTLLVFEAIRAAQPRKLYICADGPRGNVSSDAQRCADVRLIVSRVDWPCEVVSLFRETNLGCKRSVSQGIQWFFDREEEGIILEDDTLPSPEFFRYCDALLQKHRGDKRVMSVSGSYFGEAAATNAQYYYSKYSLMWGWATWRDRWRLYTLDISDYRAVLRAMKKPTTWTLAWSEAFAAVLTGQVDTWDVQWILTVWRHGGLVCRPKVNLVRNVGFGGTATHTLGDNHRLRDLKLGVLSGDFLISPDRVEYPAEDELDERLWSGINWRTSLRVRFPNVVALYRRLRRIQDRIHRVILRRARVTPRVRARSQAASD